MPTKAKPVEGEIPPNEFDELIAAIGDSGSSSNSAALALTRMQGWSTKRREAQEAFNRIETELVRKLARRVVKAERIAEDAKEMHDLGNLLGNLLDALAEHLRSYPPELFESRYDVPDSLRELKENYDAVRTKLAHIRGDMDPVEDE